MLTLTLIVVSIYTCEARRQNEFTERALESSSRPNLSMQFGAVKFPNPGEKLEARIVITNYGKTPADTFIKSTIVYSLTKMASPALPSDGVRAFIWPNGTQGIISDSPTVMTEGQVNDIKAGRGFIYVRAMSSYGRYHTEICTEGVLNKGTIPDTIDVKPIQLCSDQKANNAN